MTRRTLLGSLAGAAAPAILTSKNRIEEPGCMLAAEQTEGPYYIDQALIRRDITEGRPGIPLHLQIVILDGRRCTPVRNAAVSVWHCDAAGVYSGFTGQSPDGPPRMASHPHPPFGPGNRPPMPPPGSGFGPGGGSPPFHHGPSDNTRFFRGVQLTDNMGAAEFATIYPGWYMGRDIHIHLKVHTAGSARGGKYAGGHVCHTGQLFFPDELSDTVAKFPPYNAHHTERTLQRDDDVFTSQHGSDFILAVAQTSARNIVDGLKTRVVIGIDPAAEPQPVGFGGPPAPRL